MYKNKKRYDSCLCTYFKAFSAGDVTVFSRNNSREIGLRTENIIIYVFHIHIQRELSTILFDENKQSSFKDQCFAFYTNLRYIRIS